MEFIAQSIPDVWVIEPKVHGDKRGYFAETFRQDKLDVVLGTIYYPPGSKIEF